MIESKQEISKDLEKALQALEQAKQRVANEKKKQNEKKRNAEKFITTRKIDSFESLAKYPKMRERLQNLLEQGEKIAPKQWKAGNAVITSRV